MRKQDLLQAVVAELARGGIGDRSLRELGAAVGTSHRMLIHYFGSREGLLTEVVRTVEAEQHRFLESLAADPGSDPMRALDGMWQRLRDPQVWPAERLFFECYARACRGEAPFASLLPGLIDDWLDLTIRLGLVWPGDERTERARARAGLAMVRGLLLDLVGTEDREGVEDAFQQFRILATARPPEAEPSPARGRRVKRAQPGVASTGGAARISPDS